MLKVGAAPELMTTSPGRDAKASNSIFPPIIRSVSALRRAAGKYRSSSDRVALVPTMGALHAGHMELISAARASCSRTIVSIFVNPTQFAQSEDLQLYPRNEEEDLRKLAEAGVDLVFMPLAVEMYREDFVTSVCLSGPGRGLESTVRPHFFTAVATVVCKLLLQCQPDVAVFGEKDYQQLQVVRRMVRDLDIPSEIMAVATVREMDGLAFSSRNAYLSSTERATAPRLFEILQETAVCLREGGTVVGEIERGTALLRAAGFDGVDYLALCDGESLQPLQLLVRGARLFAAVRLGTTRLIDNLEV